MLQVLTLHLLSGTWEETQQIVSSVGEKSKLSRGRCTKAWQRVSQLEKRVKMKAEKRGKGQGWWGPISTWPTSAPRLTPQEQSSQAPSRQVLLSVPGFKPVTFKVI